MRLCLNDIITPTNPCGGSVPCPQFYNAACVKLDGTLACLPGVENPTLDVVVASLCSTLQDDESCCTLVMKITLTSAQILALSTAPIVFIPAPGAGKFIALLNISFIYNFGTAAYGNTSGHSITIAYGNALSTLLFFGQSMITGSVSKYGSLQFAASEIESPLSFINQPILVSANAAFTNGDGTLDMYITYKIINV